jgi:hypothetical protein
VRRLFVILLTLIVSAAASARAEDASRPALEATRVATAPVIDGVLDDAA